METRNLVLVSGAHGNVGKAVVEKFSSENFDVIAVVHHQPKKQGLPKTVQYQALELLNEVVVERFTSEIAENRPINAAVLTTGGFAMSDLADSKKKELDALFKKNFETVYNLARPVFLQMLEQKNGVMFFIGAHPGEEVTKGTQMIPYALSKSLLFRLAEILNKEGESANVRVYVIVPGTIDTPENRAAMPGADTSGWNLPADIANVIYQYATGKSHQPGDYIIHIK